MRNRHVGFQKAGEQRSFAAIAAGFAVLTACQPQTPAEMPQTIDVRTFLQQMPLGLSEELNESTIFPLRGKLGACRMKDNCQIDVYPSDIFLTLSILPERDGNMEISVSKIDDEGISFKRKFDFKMTATTYDSQVIKFEEDTQLFNTNLTIMAKRRPVGAMIEIR